MHSFFSPLMDADRKDVQPAGRESPLNFWRVLAGIRRQCGRVALVVWAGLSLALAMGDPPPVIRQEYGFEWAGSTGRQGKEEGQIWLYHYGWGYLNRYLLAQVDRGRAQVSFSTLLLREKVQPAPNVKAYFLLLEYPQGNYYRSADILPERLITRLLPSLEFMGTVRIEAPDSIRKIVLPAAQHWELRLESPQGVALQNRPVPVAIYMTRFNHCAVHQGILLGTYRTDEKGWLRFPGPRVPVYLDIQFFEPDGPGFAGPTFALTQGLKVYPDMKVIRQTWTLPEATYAIRLVDEKREPISGAGLHGWNRTHLCGVNHGPLGHTGKDGWIKLKLAAAQLEQLAFTLEGRPQRILSQEELRRMVRENKLIVAWPADLAGSDLSK